MLTTSSHSTNVMKFRLDALDNLNIGTEASELVDTRLTATSFLQEIIVREYKDRPNGYIRRKLENHGWAISATEYVGEWSTDRSFGDIEDNWDHDYGFENLG